MPMGCPLLLLLLLLLSILSPVSLAQSAAQWWLPLRVPALQHLCTKPCGWGFPDCNSIYLALEIHSLWSFNPSLPGQAHSLQIQHWEEVWEACRRIQHLPFTKQGNASDCCHSSIKHQYMAHLYPVLALSLLYNCYPIIPLGSGRGGVVSSVQIFKIFSCVQSQ